MIFQTRIGAHTLFAIEDGWFYRDPDELLPDSDPDVWEPEHFVSGKLRVSAGCFLLAGPHGIFMIDSGFGVGAEPYSEGGGVGQLPEALAKLHVSPDDVTAVLHTHLHPDHIGGNLTSDGEIFFPKARFYAHAKEVEHWTSGDRIGSVSQVRFQPIIEADRVELLEADREILPGTTMLETFGHTPGHMSVHVRSEGSRAFITGDVIHHPVQVEHPEWGIPADVAPQDATKTRSRLLEELTDTGTLIAAGHFPRPGLGHVIMDDRIRVFVSLAISEIT